MNADARPAPSGWTDTDVSIRLRRGAGGVVRADGVLCQAPLWFRWDGATLWLVSSGASPVGDDRIRVHVDVGPGVRAAVRSVASTVIYAARASGTRWDTDIHVADGATLHWSPEPAILTRDADHRTRTSIRAHGDARVLIDDLVVLGRTDESPGALRATLHVAHDDVDVVTTSWDTTLPGWDGPGGTAGARVVATRVAIGAAVDDLGTPPAGASPELGSAALLDPGSGCRLAIAATADVESARRALDGVLGADLDVDPGTPSPRGHAPVA